MRNSRRIASLNSRMIDWELRLIHLVPSKLLRDEETVGTQEGWEQLNNGTQRML